MWNESGIVLMEFSGWMEKLNWTSEENRIIVMGHRLWVKYIWLEWWDIGYNCSTSWMLIELMEFLVHCRRIELSHWIIGYEWVQCIAKIACWMVLTDVGKQENADCNVGYEFDSGMDGLDVEWHGSVYSRQLLVYQAYVGIIKILATFYFEIISWLVAWTN